MWHYARNVAYAARKDSESARAEADAIEAIAREHDFGDMVDGGVPVLQLLELVQLVIAGRLAQAKNDCHEVVTTVQKAAAIQDELPYLEPLYW